MKHCYSCGMPITSEVEARGDYCAYCADEHGQLHPKECVKQGIMAWLQSWGPPGRGDIERRADAYLAAMPAWCTSEPSDRD